MAAVVYPVPGVRRRRWREAVVDMLALSSPEYDELISIRSQPLNDTGVSSHWKLPRNKTNLELYGPHAAAS